MFTRIALNENRVKLIRNSSSRVKILCAVHRRYIRKHVAALIRLIISSVRPCNLGRHRFWHGVNCDTRNTHSQRTPLISVTVAAHSHRNPLKLSNRFNTRLSQSSEKIVFKRLQIKINKHNKESQTC